MTCRTPTPSIIQIFKSLKSFTLILIFKKYCKFACFIAKPIIIHK